MEQGGDKALPDPTLVLGQDDESLRGKFRGHRVQYVPGGLSLSARRSRQREEEDCDDARQSWPSAPVARVRFPRAGNTVEQNNQPSMPGSGRRGVSEWRRLSRSSSVWLEKLGSSRGTASVCFGRPTCHLHSVELRRATGTRRNPRAELEGGAGGNKTIHAAVCTVVAGQRP